MHLSKYTFIQINAYIHTYTQCLYLGFTPVRCPFSFSLHSLTSSGMYLQLYSICICIRQSEGSIQSLSIMVTKVTTPFYLEAMCNDICITYIRFPHYRWKMWFHLWNPLPANSPPKKSDILIKCLLIVNSMWIGFREEERKVIFFEVGRRGLYLFIYYILISSPTWYLNITYI